MIHWFSLKKLNLTAIFFLTIPIFLITLFWLRFSPQKQFITFSIATLVYLIFALIHHFREKTLILEIVVEYILIAILALIVVQSFLI